MTTELSVAHLPQLPGFDKENKSLVYAMIEAGWTGRITSKNHWMGRAPDRKTTITVPSKQGNNRGLANAEASFMRWLKDQLGVLPDGTPIIEARTGNEIVDGVIREGMVMSAIRSLPPQPIVVDSQPWLAKNSPGRDGGTRYESQTVVQRTWSNGHVDYVCAFTGCDWCSGNPRSVANHYGALHTAKGEVEPAEKGPLHADPAYTEPESTRGYTPTDRLVSALTDLLDSLSMKSLSRSDIAEAILTWFHERPDIEHVERVFEPLTERQILDKIRVLVGQPDPDQSMEIAALRADIVIFEEEVARLTQQRDDANARLVKVERDLKDIQDMIGEVGK